MLRARWSVSLLRLVLIAAALWLVVLAILSIPGELADEALWFRIPAQVVLTIDVLAILVVIVCVWRLLTLVQRDRLFSDASRRWVDVIVVALGVGWLVFAAAALTLTAVIFFTPAIRDPGIPMVLFGVVVLSALPALLMLVMRGLLQQATGYRAELEEII